LRSKYDNIIQSLPNDYEKTLQILEDCLTDDQIGEVLTAPNYTLANKTMLNFIMEKIKSAADVLEFCNQLEMITKLMPGQCSLIQIITELRTGLI